MHMGELLLYNPQTASNELRGAVWAQGIASGTLAHEAGHTPQFNSSHELSESGVPELKPDGTGIQVDTLSGREYQVLWSPTGYGSRVGLPAATLYNNGYIDDSMVTSIPVTDISQEFELDLEALYPGLLSQPHNGKSYAVRIELPLSQNGETVMPNRFNRTNPGAGLAPQEFIWIEYRNGEENREEGQPVNIDEVGGLPSGFVVYVEQNYHPHIEGSRSILWYPKQYKRKPDGTYEEVRDYARHPLSPMLEPFQPWTRNMVPSTKITICPQVSANGKHTVNVGINTRCQRAALSKVYLPQIVK